MKQYKRKTINIGLIFLLIISLITPFTSQQAIAAGELTVDEAIAQFDVAGKKNVSVVGYIVGYIRSETSVTPTANDDVNFAIASSANETDVSKMLYVQLTAAYRAEFGLKAKPGNLGKKVQISGSLEKYFGNHAGLKSPTAISFVDDGGEPPVENKVEAVTVSIPSSSVPKNTEIILSTKTEGASIYYTTNESEPTVSSTKYEAPIVIDKDMTIKAIAIKEGLENSVVAEFSYTVLSEEGTVSIAEARATALGQTVTVKGIVAANLKNTISIQDSTGGIAVRPTSLPLTVGDEVVLTGKLADYRGLLQLDGATIVNKSGNVGAPSPKIVTGAEVSENNESLLVQAKNITLKSVNAGNYTATDGVTEFIVRDENGSLGLIVGNTYESITGIVQQFDSDYQIIPRSVQDIVSDSSILQPVIANPGSGTFVGGTTVTLSTTTVGAEIYYTEDGTEPTKESTKYTAPIEIKKDTTIKAVVITAEGSSEVKSFEYKITDSLQIHDIQGAGHATSFDGKTVEGIQGVVTYSFELSGSTYYHIQTPDELADNDPNTSEAILLYSGKNKWPIKVGDLVSVTGKVSEYAYDGYSDANQTDLKTTQINVRNDQGGKVEVIKNGVTLPAPIIIDETKMALAKIDSDNLTVFNPTVDAIDFWESIEGMRVEVGNVKAVAPQEHGDLVTLLENAPTNSLHGGVLYEEGNQNPNRIQFRLEPNGPGRDFEVATGDKFNGPITGVVGYSFQNFKIYVSLDEMKAAHTKGTAKPEKTTIAKSEDKLTIASYNLENFSNNTKSTSNDKASKLARAIANDMQSPDIVGVTEVQDNNGEDSGDSKADQSYARLIAAIKAAGGAQYKYVNIDPVNNQDGGAPNANIRVGFLYNPERVKLTEGISSGNATTAVGYQDGKLTLNPGRIDPTNSAFNSSRKPLAAQFDFKGESVIVIANHWNSKSGDTPLFGSIQPPKYDSETQRHKIANIVYNFVEDIKTKNPDANVVSLGDFNDYQFSQSLKIHEGSLMTNMINKVETADRYTYLYQGNSQVLDHILVTKNLESKTKIDILHINADFTDMAGRASDHDPVMVQIDLLAEDVEEPIKAEKEYDFKNLKTKKLTIGQPSVSVKLDDKSVITEGILFKGAYAEFQGEGFAEHSVTIKPVNAGAIIDFKGTNVQKLIIDGTNVKEIRGAENIQEIEFINGANAETIKFTNVKGEPIEVPSLPGENKAPIVKKAISNLDVRVGETASILLTDHFSDPDNDKLTFTSTKGTVEADTLTLKLELGTHIVGVTATDGEKSVTTNFSVNVTTAGSPVDDYYKDAFGKEGQALKAALHEIIDDHTQLSYDQVWEALKETDEDPNNKNNVILFYSGVSRSKNSNGGNVGQWNREHTWAKSHGDFGTSKGPGTDIHHLRATDVQVNSARGNLDFDNGGSPVNGCNGCLKTSNSFEPPNRVKGDVARILFYMATRYEKGDKVDLELNEKLNNGKNPYHGKLSVLLQWHLQDPVDEVERNRNNIIQKWQGNRNPFIDHPEWVQLIWGQTSSSTNQKAS
ncbi:endonuclease [Psychrobacillus sp. NEAU-3TGS]|uniref:endonuclease n=1 Tax=Psychrobacillus sp. NEAU-3TGS TaxID=2995412 RepID=UPI002496615D|nr:endonuclease [Psychrobacillus sp. NEAU-3TGS]MDI2587546.1 endonuclease [Psychrobacillus sp. NEAU-3TGS]